MGMGLAETNDMRARTNARIVNMNIMKVSVLEGRVQDQPEFERRTIDQAMNGTVRRNLERG